MRPDHKKVKHGMIGRFSHRRVHSPGRRLLDFIRSVFLGGVGKSQRVYFVRIGAQRYKRVVFGDAWQAATVAANLEALGHLGAFPGIVLVHENELWVNFVQGERLDPADEIGRRALAEFFAGLYGYQPQRLSMAERPDHARLLADLKFLETVEVISPDLSRRLAARAESIRPEFLWLGYDYIDPVLKNFVTRAGKAIAIDVESLQADQPLGLGIAKSRLHWLKPPGDDFVRAIIERGAPDIRPQLDYVELAFLVAWTKRKLLTGKRGRVRPERLEEVLART